ncbi:MAG: ArsR/SmtB family transcription factor [Beijerinckiaceae bacterium]
MALPRIGNLETAPELDRMMDNARKAADFLKALSHESRLMILCFLADGEKSVGELEEFLSQRQSTVSQQLARLRLEGLVETRRDGKTIYYSLANEDVSAILDTLYNVFCKRKPARRRVGVQAQTGAPPRRS